MTTLTYLNNVWADVDTEDDDLDRFLRYRPSGYNFAPSYNTCRCGELRKYHGNASHPFKGRWDGWISMLRHREDHTRIPAGLVPYVLEQPWAQNWHIEDQRTRPEPQSLYTKELKRTLDPHQQEAVESAVTAGRGIVQYPTGSGKSIILGEVVRRLDVPTLIICDKVDLLKQLAREVSTSTGYDVGMIGGGKWEPKPLAVSTYQTFAKRLDIESPDRKETLKLLATYQAVLVDEVHHAPAKSLETILTNTPAYYRFGFSATAFRSFKHGKAADKGTFLRVQAFLGPPITELSISEGIDTGRIVKPDIFMIHGLGWEGKAINFREEYDQAIVYNSERNAMIVRLARSLMKKGPTLILVSRLDHGELLSEALGYPFLSGESKERDVYYERFRQEELKLLILSKIADEALDLPLVRYLILAGGGKARHVQTQRIGRGMRAHEGKTSVTVFDWYDEGKYLTAHSRRRRKAYEAEDAYTLINCTLEELKAWMP